MQMTKDFYIYGSQVDLLQQTIFFVFNTQNSELNFQLCEFSIICFIRDGIVFYLVFLSQNIFFHNLDMTMHVTGNCSNPLYSHFKELKEAKHPHGHYHPKNTFPIW
jgi:hypothetical protein